MVTDSPPALPDPQSLTDDLDKALVVLAHHSQKSKGSWINTTDISDSLLADHGIRLHQRRIYHLFAANPHLVARRKRNDRWEYSLLAAGALRLRRKVGAVSIVDPAAPIPAIISLHAMIGELRGTIRICDPYVDATTIEHLDACADGVSVSLLSTKLKDDGTFRRLAAAFNTRGRTLQIRRSATGKLHDRYMIDDSKLLILGTSLNGFAKKHSFVIAPGVDAREAMIRMFDTEWNVAPPWT
jgi:hypothetical protein